MFFLIRCVFWLSVVFSTIFSAQSNPPQRGQAQTAEENVQPLGDLTRSWFGTAVSFVEREALADCIKTNCLRAGQRAGREVAPAPQNAVRGEVPLPPHRPLFAAPLLRRAALENSQRAEYVIGSSGRS